MGTMIPTHSNEHFAYHMDKTFLQGKIFLHGKKKFHIEESIHIAKSFCIVNPFAWQNHFHMAKQFHIEKHFYMKRKREKKNGKHFCIAHLHASFTLLIHFTSQIQSFQLNVNKYFIFFQNQVT